MTAPSLESLDAAFHAAYDAARGGAAMAATVFVVLADSLVIYRQGQRCEHGITPPRFHALKAVAHGPIAAYVALRGHSADQALSPEGRERLVGLRARVVQAAHDCGGDPLADVSELLRVTLAFLDEAIAGAAPSAERTEAFAASASKALVRVTSEATRAQLESLDAVTRRLLGAMGEAERASLQVVVAGVHQARVRSLGMQYFAKVLGEKPGDEHRLSYAEGVTDEREALALVGTRTLDRGIARAFFGDARRLQRDVLGDAAHDLLETFAVPALAPLLATKAPPGE